MPFALRPLAPGQVRLLPGLVQQRAEINRRYLLSLTNANLLQNHYLEAGLWSIALRNTPHSGTPPADDIHWGWETPSCQVRGHFLGHWLSAAARLAAAGDAEAALRVEQVVGELRRCQERNGGEWVASIPEKYLRWISEGRTVWAPQYVVHKTLMGLYDAHAFTGNELALRSLTDAARWFHRWSGQFTRAEFDAILDYETGGMLEVWADLYGITGDQTHLDLVRRYERPRLFDRLLAGEDPLTNQHANTTIPEAQGAARAYEVTGDERYRRIVEAYWQSAVTDRGSYCTGGQTCGEVWSPPGELSARLGMRTQEHCTVYNLMRLAEYLYRWTGAPVYADYWERNLYNGILAQQHPATGMVSYFLPMQPGGHKLWGSPTHDFWCCHGTLVQAHTRHAEAVFYEDDGLVVSQYLPARCEWVRERVPVTVSLTPAPAEGPRRPNALVMDLQVSCERPMAFPLTLRLPWWLAGPVELSFNGEPGILPQAPGSLYRLERVWHEDRLHLVLPRALTVCPLPDRPDTVAFLDGPVVLAGLCDEERALTADRTRLEELLVPDTEREWGQWLPGYRAVGQERGLRFRPLHDVTEESYTLYFPLRERG